MQALKHSIVWLAVGCAGLSFFSRGAEGPSLSSAAWADFQWFSGLGFPDVKACPMVRVATGSWWQSGGDPPQNQLMSAFLLATNADSFTVLGTDLIERPLTNTPAGKPEHLRVGFEKLELKQEIHGFLDSMAKASTPREKADLFWHFGPRITERSHLFFLGWACWRQGLDPEADRLYAEAIRTPKTTGPADSSPTFRVNLETDLGHAMMWRAVVNFGNLSFSRPQLLKQFQIIITNYPHCEHQARARQTAGLLEKMIAEEQVHANASPGELERLPVEERVRELIFRLRDQNGYQWSQPGFCDIFLSATTLGTNTPADQLVNIGYPAVPQLIAALDNPTFTRSVGFQRGFYFSHTVLTVGDCAVAILQRIAGKSFYAPKSSSSYLSKDGDIPATRKALETWWAEFQQKGEKQVLLEATIAGESLQEARFLLQRYPTEATDALIKGALASTQPGTRVQLVQLLGQTKGPRIDEFLEQELRDGPLLEARAAAASLLRERGNPEGVPVMIRLWTNSPGGHSFMQAGPAAIMQFLARCDSPEAIAALGTDTQRWSLREREHLVKCVGDDEFQPKASPATATAIEQFLGRALDDTEEMMGPYGRISDLAGSFLSRRWPDRYTFDLGASLKVRDRQRVECQNVWRTAQHLPALPSPKPRTTALPPDEAVKITAIEWAPDSVKPDEEFARHIDSLQEKLLSSTNFVGVLTAYAAKPAPGSAGIDLKARKDEDLAGVTIFVRLAPGVLLKTDQEWKDVHQSGTLAKKGLLERAGGMFIQYSKDPKRWDTLAQAVERAVSAPPETPFHIRVRMLAHPPNQSQ